MQKKKLKPFKNCEKNGLRVIKTFQRCVSKKKKKIPEVILEVDDVVRK